METSTLEQVAYLAEIIGVILVIVSLIYLSSQVKQNTHQLKIQGLKEAITEFVNAFANLSENSQTTNILRKGLNNYDDLPKDEQGIFLYKIQYLCSGFNQVLMLHKTGYLIESEFIAMSNTMKGIMSCPGSRQCWNQLKSYPPGPFVTYVDELLITKDDVKPINEAFDCFKLE